MDSRNQCPWIKRKLDAELGVEVHEVCDSAVFILYRVVPANIRNHGYSAVTQVNVRSVGFVVLLKRLLDFSCVKELLVNNVANVFQHHVDLANWCALDEVFYNFSLNTTHYL